MKPISRLVIAAFAATALIPVAGTAQAQATNNQGYLTEANTPNIVRSGFGLCWHTSDWTPVQPAEQCDPSDKPVAAAAPAPKPVVVAALPPAAPVPQASKPLPQKISFSGDALFAFDKSVLKPEGKTMLDGLVRKLDGASFDTIIATGHTDRFGSNGYNQKLSERRAHAVKDYLVSQNVNANRIDAEGKGKSQPITKASDCLGAKSTKVVACLQPDRRVDIEMTGTKTVASSN